MGGRHSRNGSPSVSNRGMSNARGIKQAGAGQGIRAGGFDGCAISVFGVAHTAGPEAVGGAV